MLVDGLESTVLYRDYATGLASVNTEAGGWIAVPSGMGQDDAARLNPAGRTAAVAGYDGRLILYDYLTRKPVFETRTEGLAIVRVAFSGDGKLLATLAHPLGCIANPRVAGYGLKGKGANCPGTSVVTIRESQTGREIYSTTLESSHGVVFSADGRTLAVTSFAHITLLDIAKKQIGRVLDLTADLGTHHAGQTYTTRAAFSPDGRWLAETSHGPIFLFDLATGYVVRSLASPPQASAANSVLTKDNRLLAAVLSADHITVSELSPGISRRILKTAPNLNTIPAISADGSSLAALGADNKIQIWNIDRAVLECAIPANTLAGNGFGQMSFTDDGSLLALPAPALNDNTQGVNVWDARSCRMVENIPPAPEPAGNPTYYPPTATSLERVQRVAIGAHGRVACWVTASNTLRIWSLDGHRLIGSMRTPSPAVFSDMDTLSGKVTNRVMENQTLIPLNAAGQNRPESLLRLVQLGASIAGLSMSPDESLAAVLDHHGVARLYSTADGKLVRTLGSIRWFVPFLIDGTDIAPAGVMATMAFSQDGRQAATIWQRDRSFTLWDLATGRPLRALGQYSTWHASAAFSPDAKTVLALGEGAQIGVFDTGTGKTQATISLFGDGQEWLAHSPDGLFDGSPAAYRQIGWSFPDKGLNLPMEAFFADFFRPGLLTDILAGKRFAASRDFTGLDRRQAKTTIELAPSPTANPGVAALRIRSIPPAAENGAPAALIRDLRLFRNGSLLRTWTGDLHSGRGGAVEVTVNAPLTAGLNQFTAYGFNQDNVQTAKGELILDGPPALARKGTAYVVVAGVNRYENAQFNLRYAVADANLMAAKLIEHLKTTGRYSDVRTTALLDADATRSNIESVLVQLAGGAVDPRNARNLSKARPEDAVILFFAGHGWAQGGRFYLIPHDLGYAGQRARLADDAAGRKAILDHALSDLDLGGLVKDIDAGLVALIVDACNSGQLLESDESRRGPFNSKGLAQLAWDKGMYVLTASQSYQAALEDSRLQHGYLTYALAEEGLNQRKADRDPEDGEIDIREWFDYAAMRVPALQRERKAASRLLTQGGAPVEEAQTPRAFYRYEMGGHPVISGAMPAKPLDCTREAEARSSPGAPASLTFENAASAGARKLYVVDPSGNREFAATLAAGGTYTASTAVGNAWIVTDAAERCVAVYSVAARRQTAVIQK